MKRVLITYANRLTGHHRAAKIITRALYNKTSRKNLHIREFDVTTLKSFFNKIIVGTYLQIIKTLPVVWEFMYDNRKIIKLTSGAQALIKIKFLRKLKKYMDYYKPDVIISTQAMAAQLTSELKKRQELKSKLVGVCTDYCLNSYWLNKEIDLMFVPTEDIKQKFMEFGFKEDNVVISGIPLPLKIFEPIDIKRYRHKYRIKDNKKIILLIGGSRGIGPFEKICEALKNREDIHIIVVCGLNKRLYKALRKKFYWDKNFTIFYYLTSIEIILKISDIVITKPGGLNITEIIALKKPIIIYNQIHGQETRNKEYFLKNEAVLFYDKNADINQLIDTLITDDGLKNKLVENALKCINLDSTDIIAKTIYEKYLK